MSAIDEGAMKDKIKINWADFAYKLWLMNGDYNYVDKEIAPFLSKEITGTKQGWLRTARNSLMLSTGSVAKKLGQSRAAYAALEIREEKGNITINNLKRAAEAMDCELVYALRPKKKTLFSEIIWKKLVEPPLEHPLSRSDSERAKAYGLLQTAQKRYNDSKFRREQGWSERRKS